WGIYWPCCFLLSSLRASSSRKVYLCIVLMQELIAPRVCNSVLSSLWFGVVLFSLVIALAIDPMGNQLTSVKGSANPVIPAPEKMLHYVLKTPLAVPVVPPVRKAVFATGCYWGSEKSFWRMP